MMESDVLIITSIAKIILTYPKEKLHNIFAPLLRSILSSSFAIHVFQVDITFASVKEKLDKIIMSILCSIVEGGFAM